MTTTPLQPRTMRFDGALLERGFWIYVWRIVSVDQTFFYVGRTGDSSSPHASSPFMRTARHLDPSGKANSLRRLLDAKVDVKQCRFDLIALGPLAPEHGGGMDVHRPIRDEIAALETAVAAHIRKRGHLLGHHPLKGGAPDPSKLTELCRLVDEHLDALGDA